MVSTVYVRKLFSSASIPWFLESFGICIRSKIDQKSSAPCFFFLADEQTPELVIVDQSLGREDVASGSATNFVCSPATRLSLSLSPDSNPLPRSSHVSPPSPPSASGRSERDAPLRLHTIRTRARGLAGRRTEHDDAILPVAGRWTAHRRRSLILHSTAPGRRIPGAVPGA
jgi:hypothetical protein